MMSWTQIEGQWKTLTTQVQGKWARLSDEDVKAIAGNRGQLIGKVQKRYSLVKAEAENQVNDWIAKLSPVTEDGSHAANGSDGANGSHAANGSNGANGSHAAKGEKQKKGEHVETTATNGDASENAAPTGAPRRPMPPSKPLTKPASKNT